MDAGRFKRFHEAGRKADRDRIMRPDVVALTGDEAERTRLVCGFAVQIGQKDVSRLVVADKAAAIDMAVAGAVLQRNPPLPPRLTGDRLGKGPESLTICARHGKCAV